MISVMTRKKRNVKRTDVGDKMNVGRVEQEDRLGSGQTEFEPRAPFANELCTPYKSETRRDSSFTIACLRIISFQGIEPV